MWVGYFSSTSVNFPCGQKTLRQLSVWQGYFTSTTIKFLCSQGPPVNFCQLFVQPEDLPSTFHATGDLPSNSINFPCGQEILRQLLSTFHTDWRTSANYHQLSVQPGDLPSTFLATGRLFVNFLCGLKTFRQLSVVVGSPSINFSQLSVQPGDLLSTSVNFQCGQDNYCQLPLSPSTSINFPCGQEICCQIL